MASNTAEFMGRSTVERLWRRILEREECRKNGIFIFGVEVVVIQDTTGRIWFRGVDLVRALKGPSTSITSYVEEEYTSAYESLSIDTNVYHILPDTIFVNEMGMNLFLIRSRHPKADSYIEWFCGQVVPSICRTGKYDIDDPTLDPYEILRDVLTTKKSVKGESIAKLKKSTKNDLEIRVGEKDDCIARRTRQQVFRASRLHLTKSHHIDGHR